MKNVRARSCDGLEGTLSAHKESEKNAFIQRRDSGDLNG